MPAQPLKGATEPYYCINRTATRKRVIGAAPCSAPSDEGAVRAIARTEGEITKLPLRLFAYGKNPPPLTQGRLGIAPLFNSPR